MQIQSQWDLSCVYPTSSRYGLGYSILHFILDITYLDGGWLQAGVGCFVLNERQEVLMVQEGSGYFKGKGRHLLCSNYVCCEATPLALPLYSTPPQQQGVRHSTCVSGHD